MKGLVYQGLGATYTCTTLLADAALGKLLKNTDPRHECAPDFGGM